jgi:hypothetical protein
MLKIIDLIKLRLKNVLKDFFYDERFQMIERKKVKNFLKNIKLRSKKEVREQVLADKNI